MQPLVRLQPLSRAANKAFDEYVRCADCWRAAPAALLKNCLGFTLVELVTAMVLVGILAAIVVPRFVGRDAFESRGFTDQTVAALQFARQQAIAQRRNVCVTIAADHSLAINQSAAFDGACNQNLINPATGAAYALPPPPNGVAFGGPVFPYVLTFNANGQPNAGVVLTVNGDIPAPVITVDAVTGYVR